MIVIVFALRDGCDHRVCGRGDARAAGKFSGESAPRGRTGGTAGGGLTGRDSAALFARPTSSGSAWPCWRAFWPEQLINFNPVSFGESLQRGKAEVWLSATFNRLIILVGDARQFCESFLRKIVSLPQLPESCQEACQRGVDHTAIIQIWRCSKHPTNGSLSRVNTPKDSTGHHAVTSHPLREKLRRTLSLLPVGLALTTASAFLGCSSVPYSIDSSTYLTYERLVKEQRAESNHPLVGMYSFAFFARGLVERPDKATAVSGDCKIAVVNRSGDMDFVSMSGFAGFGPTSDQGGSFSINVQGSALWSVPFKPTQADERTFEGVSTGLFGGRKGKAKFEFIEGGWLRVQTSSGTSTVPHTETAFLRKLF